ncbi:hypothetical protein [Mesorhizobium sp. CAU 1732]
MTGSRAAGEPTVDVLGIDASGPFLIICEHTSGCGVGREASR